MEIEQRPHPEIIFYYSQQNFPSMSDRIAFSCF